MSIVKSYNRKTGVYYAYELTYEWSDERQKMFRKKRCIGKFDPVTGDIVLSRKAKLLRTLAPAETSGGSHGLISRLDGVKESLRGLSADICALNDRIRMLSEGETVSAEDVVACGE